MIVISQVVSIVVDINVRQQVVVTEHGLGLLRDQLHRPLFRLGRFVDVDASFLACLVRPLDVSVHIRHEAPEVAEHRDLFIFDLPVQLD